MRENFVVSNFRKIWICYNKQKENKNFAFGQKNVKFYFRLINDYKETRQKIVLDAVFLFFIQYYCFLHYFKA